MLAKPPKTIRLAKTTRLGRFVRGRRFDRNPLRRATDRLETMVLAVLVVAFLAGAPFAALATGGWVRGMAQRVQLAQEDSRYEVSADVLSVTQPAQGSRMVWEAKARWQAPGGQEVTAEVPVIYGTVAGDVIPVWIDRSGGLTNAPLLDSQVTGQVELGEAAAVIAAAGLLLVAGALARRALDKRRMAAWAADWAAGPSWSTRA